MLDRSVILADIEKKKKQTATLGTLNLAGFALIGGLGAVGLSTPAAPALVGASVIVTFVLRQYALVKELSEALISIQIELDRMLIIYNVMNDIAEENGFPLNTGDLIKWLNKIMKYILTIIPKDALAVVASTRSVSGFNIEEIRDIQVNSYKKPSLMVKLGTWLAPQDYVTILMIDFGRLVGSFTTLLAEFNMMVLSVDSLEKSWRGDNSFQLLLRRSSAEYTEIVEKQVSEETSKVIKSSIEEFKQYFVLPIQNLQNKEIQKAEEEKEYQSAMINMLNKSFNEANTRMGSNRLRSGLAGRSLIGGRKTRKNRSV